MKEKLVDLINNAIENMDCINITMEAGSNSVFTTVYPKVVDEGENNIIIYDLGDYYTIDTTDLAFIDDEFVAKNKYSIITISE